MNLPGSRNTSYAANQPILSADLNALQDCIIGKKHGPVTLWLPVMTAGLLINMQWSAPNLYANVDAAEIHGFPVIGLAEGTSVLGWKGRIWGAAAAGNSVATAYLQDAAGVSHALAAKTWVNPPAGWNTADFTLNGAYPAGHVMTAGEFLTVDATLAKAGMGLAAIGLVIARL